MEWASPLATTSIEELWQWADTAAPLPEGTVVVGRITANDLSGNFYRMVVVEDSSGGVALRLALRGLAGHYPVGCRVRVDAGGLIADTYNGVLHLGRSQNLWSDYTVEPLMTREDIFTRVRVCEPPVESEPTNIPTDELQPSDCGRLVRLGPLLHKVDEAENNYWGITAYGSEADRYFVTPEGATVIVRTSTYADFASSTIPSEELSIVGILYTDRYGGEDVWVLKMRDIDDATPY